MEEKDYGVEKPDGYIAKVNKSMSNVEIAI